MKLGAELIAIYPKMIRYATSLVHDKSRAEDLVMEVITRLLERQEKIPAETNIESYAMRSLKNQFIDDVRRNRAIQSDIDDEGKSIYENTADEASEQLMLSSINQEELIQHLNSLGENCKEVLTLFGLGYSYREISEIAEIVPGTVMSRMARCRASLSALL